MFREVLGNVENPTPFKKLHFSYGLVLLEASFRCVTHAPLTKSLSKWLWDWLRVHWGLSLPPHRECRPSFLQADGMYSPGRFSKQDRAAFKDPHRLQQSLDGGEYERHSLVAP